MSAIRYYVLINEPFGTHNPLEMVAYLLRNKQVGMPDDSFWELELDDWTRSDIPMAVYWLSGGDSEWRYGMYYTVEWPDVADFYCNYFSPLFYRVLEGCQTLGDVLRIYRENFNLALFYEFGLSYGTILGTHD